MGVALLDPVVAASPDPVLPTAGNERAGVNAGSRWIVDHLVDLVTRLSAGPGTRTIAFVVGGSEGGRGSRRLLATLPRPDSVVVFEAIAAEGSDSTLRVGIPVAVRAPGDTTAAAQLAWTKAKGAPPARVVNSPDARVWATAGIPTTIMAWPTVYAGTPGEIVPSGGDRGIRVNQPIPSLVDPGQPGWPVPTASLHQPAWDALEPLLRAYGVSEHEEAVAAAVRNALTPGAREASFIDGRGNVILKLGEGPPERLFVAHQDEIGYRVTSVDPDGRARVQREGGFYDWLYEGEVVRVARPDRSYSAIVAPRSTYRSAPRPVVAHPLDDEARPPAGTASRFDVGDVRVDPGIGPGSESPLRVGDDVTVRHEIARLGAHRISARAIDDRYGCAALVMAAKELWPERKHLPSTVWLVWSVEEEIGLKGAEWLADSLLKAGALPKRVHGVDTFVSSDSPLEDPRYGDAKLGQGAVIRAVDTSQEAPIEAVRATLALAKEHDIPLQYGVTSGGNDGVPFAERGSINVPLAWPLRYSHSAVEVADLRDLESLTRLIVALSREKVSDDPNRP